MGLREGDGLRSVVGVCSAWVVVVVLVGVAIISHGTRFENALYVHPFI